MLIIRTYKVPGINETKLLLYHFAQEHLLYYKHIDTNQTKSHWGIEYHVMSRRINPGHLQNMAGQIIGVRVPGNEKKGAINEKRVAISNEKNTNTRKNVKKGRLNKQVIS